VSADVLLKDMSKRVIHHLLLQEPVSASDVEPISNLLPRPVQHRHLVLFVFYVAGGFWSVKHEDFLNCIFSKLLFLCTSLPFLNKYIMDGIASSVDR
jgi:hypothetical protein